MKYWWSDAQLWYGNTDDSRDGSMMGTYFVATVQYQASMLGGNVAGSAHYYCCRMSFCWLVACQSCGPLQLHWGMSSSWGESKKCFEAQDGWLFFWGAYGTRSIATARQWQKNAWNSRIAFWAVLLHPESHCKAKQIPLKRVTIADY